MASTQALTHWVAAQHVACSSACQAATQPGAHAGLRIRFGHPAGRACRGAQVRDVCGGERGRAEAAHLLRMPQGALLRAALPEGGMGRPQSSVQAAAGAPGLGHAPQLVCVVGHSVRVSGW